jgi:hypothetical protein
MNREQWLMEALSKQVLPLVFAAAGVPAPAKVRVSVGFPKGSRGSKGAHAIGQCWSPHMSADGTAEIFIHPKLSDPVDVINVLIHEAIHATDGNKSGHKGDFKRIAKAVGLEGKMTATVLGEALRAKVVKWLETFPPYPHAALGEPGDGKGPAKGDPKKQSTRMVKAECPECGYVVRLSRKWLDVAVPQCPVHHVEMESPE